MVKMALSEEQNFTIHFDFGGHIFIFQAAITYKSKVFKAENNFQTTSKQLQTTFKKPRNRCFEPENCQNDPRQKP